MGAFQNVGLSVFPSIAGALEPPACGATFECVSLLFAGIAGVGALLGVWVHVLERRSAAEAGDVRGGVLALLPERCRRPSEKPLPPPPPLAGAGGWEDDGGAAWVDLPGPPRRLPALVIPSDLPHGGYGDAEVDMFSPKP